MKILIYTDNHFCESSSIIKKLGDKYTERLENQIKSINWAEELAETSGCDEVVCLGDFFDRPDLTDAEITALNEIRWAKLPHSFIVGNHESTHNDLKFSSTKALERVNGAVVISEATTRTVENVDICFLPYMMESSRKSIEEYFGPKTRKRVILSHNDIKNIQLGAFMSKCGFDAEEIDSGCDLFINGHLHNGQKINNKITNLGSLTGKDFGGDATKYTHNAMILNTSTMSFELIENPHAFNFYKFDVKTENDFNKLKKIKNNAVISMQCDEELVPKARELLKDERVVESRIITIRKIVSETAADISDLHVDSVVKFCECCREKLTADSILEEELSIICR